MNVKPNDKAIVEGAPVNNGLIVEVLCSVPSICCGSYGPEWLCKPAWPCKGVCVLGGYVMREYFSAEEVDIPDAWLRPIRPEADPVESTTDEEVSA